MKISICGCLSLHVLEMNWYTLLLQMFSEVTFVVDLGKAWLELLVLHSVLCLIPQPGATLVIPFQAAGGQDLMAEIN